MVVTVRVLYTVFIIQMYLNVIPHHINCNHFIENNGIRLNRNFILIKKKKKKLNKNFVRSHKNGFKLTTQPNLTQLNPY